MTTSRTAATLTPEPEKKTTNLSQALRSNIDPNLSSSSSSSASDTAPSTRLDSSSSIIKTTTAQRSAVVPTAIVDPSPSKDSVRHKNLTNDHTPKKCRLTANHVAETTTSPRLARPDIASSMTTTTTMMAQPAHDPGLPPASATTALHKETPSDATGTVAERYTGTDTATTTTTTPPHSRRPGGPEEWRLEFQSVLDTIVQTAPSGPPFAVGKPCTSLRHLYPLLRVQGLTNRLMLPLAESQARELMQLAATTSSNTNTSNNTGDTTTSTNPATTTTTTTTTTPTLATSTAGNNKNSSVSHPRPRVVSGLVDGRLVSLEEDDAAWPGTLQGLVHYCTQALSLQNTEEEYDGLIVRPRLDKLIVSNTGGYRAHHIPEYQQQQQQENNDDDDNNNNYTTLAVMVVQLPSMFEGGGLVVHQNCRRRPEGTDVHRTFHSSAKSRNTIFVTAFRAECEYERLPITSGYCLELVYKLVVPRKPPPAPPLLQEDNANRAAEVVESPIVTQEPALPAILRRLARQWETASENFPVAYGCGLEHAYNDTATPELGFANLRGRDASLADTLRRVTDDDGQQPLFVVTLRHRHPKRGNHHAAQWDPSTSRPTRQQLWIGPDDTPLHDFDLPFHAPDQLLLRVAKHAGGGHDTDSRSVLVFWPRSFQSRVVASAGPGILLSCLAASTSDAERRATAELLVQSIEAWRTPVTDRVLWGLSRAQDANLMVRALQCTTTSWCRPLVHILKTFPSDDGVRRGIRELLERVSLRACHARVSHAYLVNPLQQSTPPEKTQFDDQSLQFLTMLQNDKDGLSDFVTVARDAIVRGALRGVDSFVINSEGYACFSPDAEMTVLVALLAHHPVALEGLVHQCLATPKRVAPLLQHVMKVVPHSGTTHPSVRRLAKARLQQLQKATLWGRPIFSWRQPKANYAGQEHLAAVNEFLRGPAYSQTFAGFTGMHHAHTWASRYFGFPMICDSYSAVATAHQTGESSASVTLTKTGMVHARLVQIYDYNVAEYQYLSYVFGSTDDRHHVVQRKPAKRPPTPDVPSSAEVLPKRPKYQFGSHDDPITV